MWSMCLHTTIMEGYIILDEEIVSNGGSLCNNIHSWTTYNDNSFALSDTGDSYIKAYKPTAKQCSVEVGNGKGRRDGSKAQFSQAKGICFDYGSLFTVHTTTGTPLRMTSGVSSLEDYWKHLHLFGETFGLHTKTSTSIIVEIPKAIERQLWYKALKEQVFHLLSWKTKEGSWSLCVT